MTGYFHAAPRPLLADDAESARDLVLGVLGVTPYVDRVAELLVAAERGDPETRALIVERDGTAAAVAVFGPVAGARGAWHLRMLLVAPGLELREVGSGIVDGVVSAVADAGGRFVLAELPADPVLGRTLSLLRSKGFRQEGRVDDYYRDGVALLFLRRDL